ncbi:hypothetical protein J6590_058243 [Homalodisca vitripennis]|nr:hypothetical protein J6590_058243 [Homalodisca vitripennis]
MATGRGGLTTLVLLHSALNSDKSATESPDQTTHAVRSVPSLHCSWPASSPVSFRLCVTTCQSTASNNKLLNLATNLNIRQGAKLRKKLHKSSGVQEMKAGLDTAAAGGLLEFTGVYGHRRAVNCSYTIEHCEDTRREWIPVTRRSLTN